METENNNIEPIISTLELSSIYKSISIEATANFDELNEMQFIENCIDSCYDEEFKLIDSKILQQDINKLNLSFVKLIHYCNNNYQYKNVSKMFIIYCDYFSLDYHLTFKVLHEKLQTLIKNGLIKMLGGLKQYTKIKNKLNPETITTLFDLVSNK